MVKKVLIILSILSIILLSACKSNKRKNTGKVPESTTESTTESITGSITESSITDNSSENILESIPESSVNNSVVSSEKAETQSSFSETVSVHTPTDLEQQALDIINRYRKEAGLNTLEYNGIYYEASKTRANELPAKWSHTRPDGRQSLTAITDLGMKRPDYYGENLSRNFKADELEIAMQRLYNSETHKRNLLSKNYNKVCICIIPNGDGIYAMVQTFSS